jgi:hypothetical protein
MDMSTIATQKIVNELSGREGVKVIRVNPYEGISLNIGGTLSEDTGPAVIIIVTD